MRIGNIEIEVRRGDCLQDPQGKIHVLSNRIVVRQWQGDWLQAEKSEIITAQEADALKAEIGKAL